MLESGEMSESNSVGSEGYQSLSSYHSTQGEMTVNTLLGEVCIWCLAG